jgi:hypothetical protein
MRPVIWSAGRRSIGKWQDPDESLNSTYFTTVAISELVQELHLRGGRHRQKVFGFHIDNAKPYSSKSSAQFLEDNELKNLVHPPYSRYCPRKLLSVRNCERLT